MEEERLGNYQLHEEIGSGGMGTVYRATTVGRTPAAEVGQVVAVKVLHPHLLGTPGFFKRFLREAEAGMRVVHPNVVRTLDADATEVDGRPCHFLVVEYVSGESLRERLDRDGAISDHACRIVLRDVARGLRAIHDEGIVHRDLKPENILITRSGKIKLMDLGVAHLKDEAVRLSQTGQFVGTIDYAAPEQFQTTKGKLDGRADLYALGLTVFEILTGDHPFRHDELHVAIRRQLTKEAPRIRESRPEVSKLLDKVVDRLLAKDPGERLATANTLLEILETGEVPAKVISRARREDRIALVAGAVILLLAAAGGWWYFAGTRDPGSEPPIEKAESSAGDSTPEKPLPVDPEPATPVPEKAEAPLTPESRERPPDEPLKEPEQKGMAEQLEALAAEASDDQTALAYLNSARSLYEKLGDRKAAARVSLIRQRIVEKVAGEAVAALDASDEDKARTLIALARIETRLGSEPEGKEGEAMATLRKGTGTIRFALAEAGPDEEGIPTGKLLAMHLAPKPWGLAAKSDWLPHLRWPPGTYELTLLDRENKRVLLRREVQVDAGRVLVVPVPLAVPAGMRFVTRGRMPSFLMDECEVTVGEFRNQFPARKFQWDDPDLPAHGISYAEAQAYAYKVGKQLPYRSQWQLAAFGDGAQRRYPWGDEDPVGRAHIGQTALAKVGSYPRGVSPYGVKDLAGNVWEWLREDTPGSHWVIGGGYRYPRLAATIGGGPQAISVNFLQDPKPSDDTYRQLAVEARKYRSYRVTQRNIVECGFRCVINLF